MLETSSTHLKNDLKEDAKRDTNDFLRESANPAEDFRALMREATPFYKIMITRLPEKNDPEFELHLHNLFKVSCNFNQFIQQEIVDLVAAKENISSTLLRKEFKKFTMIANGHASTDELRLGSTLINYYVTQNGISTTPQQPLRTIVGTVVNRLVAFGIEFFLDKSTQSLFMRTPDRKVMEMDPRAQAFSAWAFKTLELSTTGRDPVKDIIAGTCALVADAEYSKHFARINFFEFIEDDGEVVAAFPTGNERQDVFVVRPSVDGKIPSVEIVPNGYNQDDLCVFPPPLQATPIEYLGHACTVEGMKWLKILLHDSQALSEPDKLRSAAHKLQMIFPAPTRRKMRKANRGLQGSGKSTDADLFTTFVYGEPANGAYNEEKELWSTAHYNPVQSIDNWEGLKKKYQEEFALLHATGGNKQFRKLYTDRVMLTYTGRSQIVETGIEGFTSPEAREREQEYFFDKKYQDPGFSIRRAEAQAKTYRNVMWSAYFSALSLMVLPNYQKQMDHYEKYLAKQPHPKQRFNDFLARQALMVDLVRKYWNITKSTEEILDLWIEQWSNEAEKSDTEIDQAVQRLQIVFTNPKYMMTDTKADDLKVCDYCAQLEHGVTSNELHTIFCAVEKEFGLPRAYGSAAALAQRIKNSVRIWAKSHGTCTIGQRGKLTTYSFSYLRDGNP